MKVKIRLYLERTGGIKEVRTRSYGEKHEDSNRRGSVFRVFSGLAVLEELHVLILAFKFQVLWFSWSEITTPPHLGHCFLPSALTVLFFFCFPFKKSYFFPSRNFHKRVICIIACILRRSTRVSIMVKLVLVLAAKE